MKIKNLTLSFVALILLTSASKVTKTQHDISEKLIGTWIWKTVLDGESNKDLGLDVITMGMASEVKTEFKTDNSYIESKMRKGSDEYSQTTGEWKIENNETLNLKSRDKWRPSKILKITTDSLLLQMNPKMYLLMIKQK